MELWEHFVEATGRHFHFLETEFGFTQKLAKPPFVIYETDQLQVTVYYEVGRHHELDWGVRRLGDDVRNTPSVELAPKPLASRFRK